MKMQSLNESSSQSTVVKDDHLNNQSKTLNSQQRTKLLVGKSSSTFQLPRHKLTNLRFSKRNPRKPLLSSRVRSITDSTTIASASCQDSSMVATLDPTTEQDGSSDLYKVGEKPPSTLRSVNAVQQILSIGQQTETTRKVSLEWLEQCLGEKIMPLTRIHSFSSDSGFGSILIDDNETTPQKISNDEIACKRKEED